MESVNRISLITSIILIVICTLNNLTYVEGDFGNWFFQQDDADKILDHHATKPSVARAACRQLGEAVHDEWLRGPEATLLNHRPKPAHLEDKTIFELFRSYVNDYESIKDRWLNFMLGEYLKDCASFCFKLLDPESGYSDEDVDDENLNDRVVVTSATSRSSDTPDEKGLVDLINARRKWRITRPEDSMKHEKLIESVSDNEVELRKVEVVNPQRARKWRHLEPGED